MFDSDVAIVLTYADQVSSPVADGCVISVPVVPEERGENKSVEDMLCASAEGTDLVGESSVDMLLPPLFDTVLIAPSEVDHLSIGIC